MKTGVVFHPKYLQHEQTPTHPERKERLAYTLDQLIEEGLFDLGVVLLEPYHASESDVLAVHSQEYFNFLKQKSKTGGIIDWDTVIPVDLIDAALLAAGGAIRAAEAVSKREVDNAFAMVRPPGHHAKPNIGAGFCYLNNIAIAVRWLQRNGYKKILIIDWDAHHGDGTQEIFYDDPSVLFISLHQMPLYPGTGYPYEVGIGEGEGYTVNVPLPPGAGDECYLAVFDEIIEPLAIDFDPDFIAISAGQDNHFTDPLTGLALTANGYGELMKRAVALAGKLCGGRVFAVLEGGYSVEKALPYTNLAIICAMAGLDVVIEENVGELSLRKRDVMDMVRATIQEVKRIHSQYWGCFL